jgi:glycosyltransferase involved in cell wall biosynthesis
VSPSISVVICAYTLERWADLQRAAASVRAQTLSALETIVIIDGNEALLALATAELNGVTVLRNVHRPGLSGGRQTAADYASGEILAFLDDDAIADVEWLAEMAPAYADANVLGVGGLVAPIWSNPVPRWLPPEFYWVIGCTYTGMPVSNGRIRNPIGANMSMRRTVIRGTGPFEPRLGRVERGKPVSGTAEETEYCIRAAQRHPGGYWAYRPRSRVRHVVTPQRSTWSYFVLRCRVEGRAKAILTELTGAGAGLSAERSYVRSALPRAVARELRCAARGRPVGLACAAAVLAGFSITTAAYLATRVAMIAGTRRGQR